MSNYRVARLDAIEELDDGREPYRPVRHHFGITSFGITAWTGREAGDRILNEHDEADATGPQRGALPRPERPRRLRARRRAGRRAGRHVRLRRARRQADGVRGGGRDDDRRDRRRPGKAYEPVGWELWAPIRPRYEAGEHEAAGRAPVAARRGQSRSTRSSPTTSRVSRASPAARDEAIEHLRQAIEGSELFRDYAKGDSDLDPIREEPAFRELVGD